MIWANSGDSHFLEPTDLYTSGLPASLVDRAPRTTRDGSEETVYVDGQVIKRKIPLIKEGEFEGMTAFEQVHRAPGARDVKLRLKDLDNEGIWGELVYPSVGMWNQMIRDPALAREMVRVCNDWALDEIGGASHRLVVAAMISMLSVTDAVDEVGRIASMGAKCVFIPTQPPEGMADYNRPDWIPLWAALEEAGIVIGVHIGTDRNIVPYGGPGGAILNYVQAGTSAQHVVCQLIASGALDRHPNLKILVSEGGASWAPFLGDRMDEWARQQHFWTDPKLSLLPSEYINRQVYASFQHDKSAIPAYVASGYRNVLWGSDYPHTEGTFGHTQETLRGLFADVDDSVRRAITIDNFLELFPSVGLPPALAA